MTPRWAYVGPTTVRSTMEVMGYSALQAMPPSDDMVKEVERSLRTRPHEVSGPMVYGRGDRDACANFLKFGTQQSDFDRKIEEIIGRHGFFLHQGPVIIHSSDQPTNLGIHAAHPSRTGISVFRALSSDPDKVMAALTLYPWSHHISSTEFAEVDQTTRSFNLHANTILFVRGSFKMESLQPAGGYLVWQGFLERPWGLDPASPEAFAFMRI